VGVRFDELDLSSLDHAEVEALLLEDAERAYTAREAELGRDLLANLERLVLLDLLDRRLHLERLGRGRRGGRIVSPRGPATPRRVKL
jgi:preprotein translocase subunit SecA